MMQMWAYRVQAADGRGPWRPGFSHTWIDGDAPADRLVETVMDLYPAIRSLPLTMTYGCACRTLADLMSWFTAIERQRLSQLGFFPVRLNIDLVVAESSSQMLIGRKQPFQDGATRLSWPWK